MLQLRRNGRLTITGRIRSLYLKNLLLLEGYIVYLYFCRNYARCTSPEPGIEVITGNRKFANEVYIGRFPCPVDRWEIAHFARYLGFPIWPNDVRCPGRGLTYGFIMMRNSRDVHAICSGGPYLFNGRMVRVDISAKGKAARGLRDQRSVKWFHGK